jgi:hypothetical protein
LLFLSLPPFLAHGDIFVFFIFFFMVWFVFHTFMVRRKVSFGELKSFRDSFSRKNISTLSYPLVPVILITFILWWLFSFILWWFLRCILLS